MDVKRHDDGSHRVKPAGYRYRHAVFRHRDILGFSSRLHALDFWNSIARAWACSADEHCRTRPLLATLWRRTGRDVHPSDSRLDEHVRSASVSSIQLKMVVWRSALRD